MSKKSAEKWLRDFSRKHGIVEAGKCPQCWGNGRTQSLISIFAGGNPQPCEYCKGTGREFLQPS